jgi:hypothetical protein
MTTGCGPRGVCDRCGHWRWLNDLKYQTVEGVRTGLRVCEKCYDFDFKTIITPIDKEFVKDPRPDETVRSLAGNPPPADVLFLDTKKAWAV